MTQKNSLGDADARHTQLHQLLQSDPRSERACDIYLPQLSSYIDAQLAGEAYLTRYADLAIHLDSCVACAGLYARLYELELALAAEALPEPGEIPAPDLSFLSVPESASPTSLADLTRTLRPLLADAFTSAADKIRLQLSAELLVFLQPLQTAPLTRSSVEDARYHEVLYKLEPEQVPQTAMPIKLTAYRDAHQPEQCLLEVIITPPGEQWPNLGGRTVTLQMGDDRLTTTTDAWGVAVFVDIPIARLNEVALDIVLLQ